ncbi:hypothetical protein [Rubinisphaera brasiliensis]|nr:hypothetical protein [Rubinisphaera brasiliensis]
MVLPDNQFGNIPGKLATLVLYFFRNFVSRLFSHKCAPFVWNFDGRMKKAPPGERG